MNMDLVEPAGIMSDEAPSLNYDLRSRIKSNIIFWSTLVLTVTIIPIIIYYPLVNLTKLDTAAILGICSACQGVPSMIQLPYRFWQLWKQDGGDRRPLSGKIPDLFMYEYIVNFIVIAVSYSVSTAIPIPAWYLMTPSILVGSVSLQFFPSLLRPRSPVWLSSLPPGHKMRPAAYYIMEDIVAVDGAGRSAFRRALNVRYESSPIFQRLVYEMTAYWAIGGLIFVGVSAAFTFATSLNFAFGATLTWIPVWTILWLIPGYLWIQRRLTQESDSFRKQTNHQIKPS